MQSSRRTLLWTRTLARRFGQLVLRHRLPITSGSIEVRGLDTVVTIVRDRWGIPHISAQTDHDAWFALGFCQAQDRTFQLEFLRRLIRGELAEIVGPPGLTFDRLARRIGFRRASIRQLSHLPNDIHAQVDAFLAGIRAGLEHGLPARPLEFLLLRTEPQPWDAADVLGLVKFLSFALASNWTSELIRLLVLVTDGREALRDLDPALTTGIDAYEAPTTIAASWLEQFSRELDQLRGLVGTAASNNWVIAGDRTQSGRPILANDPHWSPLLPSFWYLAHLITPAWAIAGATLIGTPAFIAGHNGFAAWGVTAGLSDNTDLVLEALGPDGKTVREGDRFVPCTVYQETIRVRGHGAVTDLVLETRRGPIVSPALRGVPWAVSMRAVWLDPLSIRGLLDMHRVRSFEALEQAFADWPHLPLNLVYADSAGTIGWLLTGTVPQRRSSSGLLPICGWENPDPWLGYVPSERLPRLVNPPEKFIATANNRPPQRHGALPLGADYLDPYRFERIASVIADRFDWDRDAVLALQLDTYSLPWMQIGHFFRNLPAQTPLVEQALALLRDWDGNVSADSAAASVFELLLHRLAARVAQARAPQSWRWVLGAGFHDLAGGTSWGVRRIAHLLRLLDARPSGWFQSDWEEVLTETLQDVVQELHDRYGSDSARWAWGSIRPLTLRHPLGASPSLRWLFDRGPFPIGGDANTVNPAGVSAHDPLGPVQFIASLRFVVELGAWDEARIVLFGGQSGHPLSPHYDDLLRFWLRGKSVPLAWSSVAVQRVAHAVLELRPHRG
ncbi:Penicillin acylase 2 [bacterium HR28]|nr:Penicillin acylase 2 [bacterium HR28]